MIQTAIPAKTITGIDDFLKLLNEVKKLPNGQFMALCPGHDDRKQSLSVTDAGGRIMLHCFAGCEEADVLKPLGLEPKDLILNRAEQSGSGIIATYDYTDAEGKLLYQVVRYC